MYLRIFYCNRLVKYNDKQIYDKQTFYIIERLVDRVSFTSSYTDPAERNEAQFRKCVKILS